MFQLYILPAAFALFVWWFSTGIIMYLDGLPQKTFKWSILGATLLLVASLVTLRISADTVSVRAAYLAFTAGLLAWGWQEISFYMGFVTGTRRDPCGANCRGWRHFGHAIQTSLWHELAIIAAGVLIVGLTWHRPNQIGMWTFMVLWWMHQSAKLNVFLGVRNLNEEFLPEHLQFLKSFLTKKSMNLLFPVSVTVSTVILVHLVDAASAANASRFTAAGYCFLSTLMALAILEHWLLMLPLPAAALWGWSLKSRKPVAAFDIEIVAGFLGAGKTTLLRNRLQQAGPRTIVLVNDFASVGIDGSLLSGLGADVVELPNGCICCTLKQDLAAQLQTIVADHAPERIVIEPSGVADLASLLAVLNQPALAAMIRARHVVTVIDAGAFLGDLRRMQDHLEAQIRPADAIIVSKSDLVPFSMLDVVVSTIAPLNPTAPIDIALHGVVTGRLSTPAPSPIAAAAAPTSPHHDHAHHAHAHGHDHALAAYASWTRTIEHAIDPDRLADLLEAARTGRFGGVIRLKGIARSGDGWLRFDLSGGHARTTGFSPAGHETARVVAIGSDLLGDALDAAFDACFEPTLEIAE